MVRENYRTWTAEEDDVLRSMAHLPLSQLAAVLGRTENSVGSRASSIGLSFGRNHGRNDITTVDGFMGRIEFDLNGGCWLWNRHLTEDGYGRAARGGYGKAHRLSWSLFRGGIPDGLCVLHRCDVRACVNPNHLFLGTVADNNADRDAKGRKASLVGKNNSRAIIPEDHIPAIRASTVSARVLAKFYGVSPACIANIRKRKSWTHIP